MADFPLLKYSKLISRKIWVIEKSSNFHTVDDDAFFPRTLRTWGGHRFSHASLVWGQVIILTEKEKIVYRFE